MSEATEPKTEFGKLRKRYEKVRGDVKDSVQTALQSGTKPSKISGLRTGAFLATEKKQGELDESERKREKAEKNSLIDPLTGLHNRRWFDEEIVRKIKEVQRTESPLFLVAIDVNNLDLINAWFGHPGGDIALKLMRQLPAREDEPISRTGGDEFMQLLDRKLMLEQVKQVITRYQEILLGISRIKFGEFPIQKGVDPQSVLREVSLSFGVAKYDGKETPEEFISRADSALIHTKQNGKKGTYIANGKGEDITFTQI